MKKREHIEVTLGRGKQPWHVRLRAANGRVLVSTEQFPSKSNAVRAARALRRRLRAYTPIRVLA